MLYLTTKRAIRIIAYKYNRDSCRQLFNQYQILTLHAQYIFSLVIFVIKHSEFFPPNSECHDMNTRNKQNSHFPATMLSLVQKGVLYFGIGIFNHLPEDVNLSLKILNNLNIN